jgi:hypothetical protein
MSYYAQPRMTRDIDLVISIKHQLINEMEKFFAPEYYFSEESVRDAVENDFIFNLIHKKSSIKVDCIIKKNQDYRIVEFDRKRKIKIKDFEVFIVSQEDLIISKLVWQQESGSEIQKKDIQNLLTSDVDEDYLNKWIVKLNLKNVFNIIRNERYNT